MIPTEELCTAAEIAKLLGVKPSTIKLWGKEGKIPRIKLGHKTIRYDKVQVMAFLKGAASMELDRPENTGNAHLGRSGHEA